MRKYRFLPAAETDIRRMSEIENEFFGQYSRAITEEMMREWFVHNPAMFFTVKNQDDHILGFCIMNPVNHALYQKLRSGLVSDIFDFQKDEVCRDFVSEYFYMADICVTNTKRKVDSIMAANTLLSGIIEQMYRHARFVLTSPITPEGVKMCEHMGFHQVAEEIYHGISYPICELVVSREHYEKVRRKERK